MRLDDQRESGNIEDQRGGGGFGGSGGGLGFGGGGGGGMGGLIGLLFAARGFGIPMWLIIGGGILYLLFSGGLGGMLGGAPTTAPTRQTGGFQAPAASSSQPGAPAAVNQTDSFVRKVLGSTEDTWSALFQKQGADYPEPTLVFYSGRGMSGCGSAQSAMGPFYCPADRKIYLDTSFFDELARMGGPGDFAGAYVIAHEVGHHIQTVTGVADQVRRAQARAGKAEENALQVRMELQADCYAGVWGGQNRTLLDAGDIDEAMRAAQAIGDDTLQRSAGQRVRPESFTHGSATQRKTWFMRGFQSGDPAQCDTFNAATL